MLVHHTTTKGNRRRHTVTIRTPVIAAIIAVLVAVYAYHRSTPKRVELARDEAGWTVAWWER